MENKKQETIIDKETDGRGLGLPAHVPLRGQHNECMDSVLEDKYDQLPQGAHHCS